MEGTSPVNSVLRPILTLGLSEWQANNAREREKRNKNRQKNFGIACERYTI